MRLRHLYIFILFALIAATPIFAQDYMRTALGPGVESGGPGGLHTGPDLQRKSLDQTVFPNARCNDNSPAILYFRPASRPADARKWVIHLQGGGSCGNGLDCSERWANVNTHFGSNNMTSVDFPLATNASGILERDAPFGGQNPIAGYNQVLVHYCSSDVWSGTRADLVLNGVNFNQDPPACTQYKINFLGRYIFDAAIQTLRRNGVPPLLYVLSNPTHPIPLPDLDDAEFVLLSGGSAGGAGVIHNLDHLRTMLPASTRLVGLSDSAFRPPKVNMDLSQTPLCLSKGACTDDAQNQWVYNNGPWVVWGQQNGTDNSCLNYHPTDPWQCTDSHHILVNHVHTSFFVRMAELDPMALSEYQGDNIFLPNSTSNPISDLEFAQAVRSDIRSLALLPITSEEHVPFIPGAFSAACSQHDVLMSDKDVYGTVIHRPGEFIRMFDVLEAWIRGTNPSIIAAAPDRSDSRCPRDE